jgi:hypothetical protein
MAQIPTDKNYLNPMGDFRIAVAIGAIPGWSWYTQSTANFSRGVEHSIVFSRGRSQRGNPSGHRMLDAHSTRAGF